MLSQVNPGLAFENLGPQLSRYQLANRGCPLLRAAPTCVDSAFAGCGNLASLKYGFASLSFKTSSAIISPTTGPCLNPCPDPPPSSHTFSAAGCRSTMKWLSGVCSYWQTRVSTSGASFMAGKRSARYSRMALRPSGFTTRSPLVGSKVGPRVSSAILKPRPWLPGMP